MSPPTRRSGPHHEAASQSKNTDTRIIAPAWDTPANHRDAKWLADTMATLGDRKIHNRGLHYAILGQTKPDGSAYVSDDECWTFMVKASNLARWLGYIEFDQIKDERNAAPVIRKYSEPTQRSYIGGFSVNVEITDAANIEPYVDTYWVDGEGEVHGGIGTRQPYKLVFVGEKSSLEDVLGPIANRYKADLYLPTGTISNTLIYSIAKVGTEDGRPMVVLYFADADPAGWGMGIEVGRKVQAFRDSHFPELEFELHRAALTIDQVREFGLPSTPLKPTEKRADKWRAAFGVEQTEIDALATLRPELLRQVARDAVAPFFDSDLDRRASEAREEWRARAQAILDEAIDPAYLAELQAQAEQRLTELREQIDEINNALRIEPGDIELPPIETPQAELTERLAPEPLIDSRWSWIEQTRRLIASEAYEGGGA